MKHVNCENEMLFKLGKLLYRESGNEDTNIYIRVYTSLFRRNINNILVK